MTKAFENTERDRLLWRSRAWEAEEQNRELRAWKESAMTELARWDAVWAALGKPGTLGGSKAEGSLAEVKRLHSAVPIVDDATRREVEDMVLGTLPSRCPATLGKRPTWMGVDQYDPCSCRLPNGHDGDHECAHGAEPNMHPGELKRLLPTVTGRAAELLAAAYLGGTD